MEDTLLKVKVLEPLLQWKTKKYGLEVKVDGVVQDTVDMTQEQFDKFSKVFKLELVEEAVSNE